MISILKAGTKKGNNAHVYIKGIECISCQKIITLFWFIHFLKIIKTEPVNGRLVIGRVVGYYWMVLFGSQLKIK